MVCNCSKKFVEIMSSYFFQYFQHAIAENIKFSRGKYARLELWVDGIKLFEGHE